MNAAARNAGLASATTNDPRWASVVTREKAADGKFYYSVKTTGEYCRPSCAARLAKPENVQSHAMPQEAEKVGFRPCKRRKPDQPSRVEQHASRITRVCRLLEQSHEVLKHGVFKAVTGLTPNPYATANRSERVRAKLTKSYLVTEAIYDAGFNSNGRFYETSTEVLGNDSI